MILMKKLLLIIFLCGSLASLAEEFATTESAFTPVSEEVATESAITILSEENSLFSNEDSNFEDFSDTKDDNSGFDSVQKNPLVFEGVFKFNGRDYTGKNFKLETLPELDLKVKLNFKDTKVFTTLNFQKGNETVSDIFREGYAKLAYNKFDIDVGLMKLVWGKTDKVHVVDNLNYTDYSDFLNPEFIDRKKAEKMIRFNYFLPNGGIEAVYAPEFHADIYPASGVWGQSSLAILNSAFKDVGTTYEEQFQSAEKKAENGQFALRYTNSFNGFDFGFSDYQGYMKKPSINKMALTNPTSPTFLNNLNMHFDKVNIMGAEIATVKLGINWRGELAYFITSDTKGDDPAVANNKVNYIIGGDKDLPLNNVNLNIQVVGEYKMNSDKIKKNFIVTSPTTTFNYDTDYDSQGKYSTTLIITQISDKYMNEKLKPNVKFYYNVEKHDYIIKPEVVLALNDERTLSIAYSAYGGKDDTLFGQFDGNDFIEAKLDVKF
jgi:hypothetical protein